MTVRRHIGWSKLVRWTGTILLVGWLLTLVDIGHTIQIITSSRLDLIIAALLVLIAIRLVMTWRWLYVLRALSIDARFIEVFRITMISIALSLVMPGGHAAVDTYRTWSMSRLRGSVSMVTASVAADRIFGFYSLILVAFVAVLVAPDLPGPIDWRWTISWGFSIATLATALVLILGPRMMVGGASWLSRWPRLQDAVSQVAEHLSDASILRRIAIPSTLLAVPLQVLRALEFYLIFVAVGAEVDFSYMLIYSPLVFLLMLLPISVAGIGLREGSFFLFLAPHGVSLDAVVAAGVLFHVLGIVMGLPGALWISTHSPGPMGQDQAVEAPQGK